MLIQELTKQASLDLLARSHVGRLGCAREGQPYIVPTYFAYANNCLYSFSTIGQKIDWMRTNPLVCLQNGRGGERGALGKCHRLRSVRRASRRARVAERASISPPTATKEGNVVGTWLR